MTENRYPPQIRDGHFTVRRDRTDGENGHRLVLLTLKGEELASSDKVGRRGEAVMLGHRAVALSPGAEIVLLDDGNTVLRMLAEALEPSADLPDPGGKNRGVPRRSLRGS